MPGLTDASGFPKMWAGTGRDFPAIIDSLISLAIERASRQIEKQDESGRLKMGTPIVFCSVGKN